jgi:hypothetical protein
MLQRSCILVVLFLVMHPQSMFSSADETKLTSEELVARHLEAIGSAAARSAVKTRVVQGSAVYAPIVGGGGRVEGKTGLVSEGHKLRFMMKFNQGDYRGENVVFNGSAMGLAFATSNQSRSVFGAFLSSQDAIVREGLLPGVLSTAWPLLDIENRKPKIILEGLKRIDGTAAYQVRYLPHKHSDLQILLYFDQETFRHIKSVYSLDVGNNVGPSITESIRLQADRTTLEEWFSDFQTIDGLTLPSHWKIHFTRELPNGATTVTEWDLKEDEVTHNMGLDPRNFEVK